MWTDMVYKKPGSRRVLIVEKHHLPYNPDNVVKARKLRRRMTKPEKKLWYEFLCTLNLRVLRQRPIGNYIVDFFCPSKKLVIEIDGDSHFIEGAKERDKKRTQVLELYGLKVVRFCNNDVINNFDGVCEALTTFLL